VNARVDSHTEPRKALLLGPQRVESDFAFAEFQAHPFQPDLLKEAQVVIGNAFGVEAVAQLGISGIRFVDRRWALLRQQGHARGPERKV
jgi:hypothetical protein